MNIPELKEAMEYLKPFGTESEALKVPQEPFNIALQTLLSTCQLLCNTSDKMLPKKEVVEKHLYDMGKDDGYNLAREEDILWLTKKMMGLPEILKEASTFTYKRKNYEGEEKICFLPTEEIRKVVANAIIQSFGQEKGGE